MPGPLELFSICYTAVNLTYGLRGTPSFLSVDPFTDNTSYVVTEFDCSSIDSEYCTNTTDHSNDGCALYGGYAAVTCAHVCEDDDRRLFNERNYTTSDGLLRVVGIPQTCSGGGWEAICNDGSNDGNLPDLICQDAGYRGGYLVSSNRTLYGASQPGSFYLTDVTCIDSVDNCTADYTFTDECLSGNYDYTVECFDYEVCAPGYIELASSVESTSPEGFYYTTGYPEVCVDDQYVPLCNNTDLGLLEFTNICQNTVNLTYGFPGAPSFISVEPYLNSSQYVVTSLICDLSTDCTNETTHSNNGCTMNGGGYTLVTCAHSCNEGSSRLYNNMTTFTSDGLLRVSGIPQLCKDGGWSSVCTIGSIDSQLPSVICQSWNYQDGEVIIYNSSIHDISPLGSFYSTNFSCESNTLQSCASTLSYDSHCLNGSSEYLIQCFNIQRSPNIALSSDDVSLLQSSTATFTCQFSGDPTPQVHWTFIPPSPRQSVILTSMGPYTILNTIADNTVNSTLTISSVMLSNAGVYRCSASNGAPTQPSGDATLTVSAIPNITVYAANTINPTENDPYVFTCIVSNGFPVLSITWRKDSTITVLDSSRITITTSSVQDPNTLYYTTTSVLNITSTALSDTGSYTCRTSPVPVYNQPVISSTLALSVQVRNECVIEAPLDQSSPCVNGLCIDGTNTFYCQCFDGYTGTICDETVVTPTAPMFETLPTLQSVLLQEPAMFSCIVSGEPQPTITWFKDDEMITDEISPSLSFLSVDTSDRGVYSCRASNSEGSITSDGALLRIENVAQFISVVNTSSSSSAVKKRQSSTIEDFLNDVSDLFIGQQVGPSGIVVGLDAVLVSGNIQAILTVRTPITVDGRPNTTGLTDGLNSVTLAVAMQRPDLSFSPVIRFDGCLPDDTLLFGSVQLMWPEVGAKENATVPCPCGEISDNTGLYATRMCYGDFISISQWLQPHTQLCQYDMLSQQLCTAAEISDPLQGAEMLSNVTANAGSFTEDNFAIASALLSNYVNNDDLSPELATELVSTVDKMINVPEETLAANPTLANEVLNSIDALASNIELSENGEATVIQPNIAVMAQEVVPGNFTGLMFSIATGDNGRLDNNALSGERPFTASVDIPDNLLQGILNAERVALSVQTDSTFYVQATTSLSETIAIIVSVDVFTGSGKANVDNLDTPISFQFVTQSRSNDFSGTIVCTFWDTIKSEWSSEGCTTLLKDDAVTCNCDHLSSFTVVEVPQASPPVTTPTFEPETTPTIRTTEELETDKDYEVQAIIIVGAGISILMVLLSVLLRLCSSNHRATQEGKVIICSHVCLIVLYVTLVLASIASYTDSSGFCGTFSGLFHYMSLVYVMWIFTEGLYYIVKLKYGIGGNSLTRYLFRIMFVTSFAIPLVVVIVSVGLGYDYYAVDNSFCRPQSYSFYYGYIIPVGLIYITGMICLIMGTLITLLSSMKGSERKQLLRPHLLAATILGLIILVAWVFGMVGTDNGVIGSISTATQYIFGFLLILHSIVLLLLTLFCTENIRAFCLSCLNRTTGRSGKYAFAEYTIDSKGMTNPMGVMEISTSQSDSSTIQKSTGQDDTMPFREDREHSEVYTSFSSKNEEMKIQQELERKQIKEKEIEESVIANTPVVEEA